MVQLDDCGSSDGIGNFCGRNNCAGVVVPAVASVVNGGGTGG